MPTLISQPQRRSANSVARKIRYAVVGAGHIAQNAVLPAFANARKECELAAIVSGDPRKQRALQRMYDVEQMLAYDDFDAACQAHLFDAVYIALPNDMHCDFTCRAAAAGVHVLCEKPMAVSSAECMAMIDACRDANVRLMIAYRLHFEKANLKAVEIAQGGKLGELRYFTSAFSMQVKPDNIRVQAERGGGPLYDIGIYCINAARYLFREEPTSVLALQGRRGGDPRFAEVPEAVSVALSFPRGRLASFTCSFGAADVSHYQIVGTKGDLCVDPAYEYEGELKHQLTINGKTRETTFAKRDQFAPELLYFSECIRKGIDPETGGPEGLIDVRIIEAIKESIASGQRVPLERFDFDRPPSMAQERRQPAPRKKRLVNVDSAHQ